MANLSYVRPVQIDLSDVLGVANLFERKGQQRLAEAKERQIMEARQQAGRLLESGTPEEIEAFALQNPTVGSDLMGIIGGRRARNAKLAKAHDDAFSDTLRNTITSTDNQSAGRSWVDLASRIQQEGGDPSNAVKIAEEFLQDPEQARQHLRSLYAVMDPKGSKELRELTQSPVEQDTRTPAIKEFEYGLEHPEFALRKQKKADKENEFKLKKQSFTDTKKLRDEFVKQSGDYIKIRDAHTRILQSAKEPTGASDLSLIFNYMKMLDPGSVVRESEFATAENSANVPQRVRGVYNKIVEGDRLSPDTRAKFLKAASHLMEGTQKQHEKREKTYRDLAKRNNLPEEDVVIDLMAPEEVEPEQKVLVYNPQTGGFD